MKVIGLTGGVASGKSSVANVFAQLGAKIIDADIIAHQITDVGKSGLQAIIKQFGSSVLLPDGSLNRRKLRAMIFKDEFARLRLENVLHPLIEVEIKNQLAKITSPYCIVVIPLLFEAHCETWVDRILVVDVPEATQIARLCQRDGISKDLAEKMLAAQASRQYRLIHADDVIENSGSVLVLAERVKELHERYRILK